MGLKYQFHQSSGAIENETLFLEYGLRKVSYPLKEITGFHRFKSFGMDTLVIASGSPGGRVKSETIILGKEQVPEAFIEELVASAPKSANMLDLPKKEAFKKMGVAGRMRNAMISVIVLIFLLVGAIFAPQVYHGIMDRDLTATSVDEIYAGTPLPSNYVGLAVRLPADPLVVTYTKWWSTSRPYFERRKKGFYPIVPANWKQGDPIKLVLMVDGGHDLKNLAVHEGREIQIQGVVRNVLWERFFWSGSMDDLSRHAKSPVEHPLVIGYNVSPVNEMLWYIGGTLVLVSLFLGIATWRSRARAHG